MLHEVRYEVTPLSTKVAKDIGRCANNNTDAQRQSEQPLKSLRRPQSLRCLSYSFGSRSTLGDDDESVYNAEVVRSFEDLVPLEGMTYIHGGPRSESFREGIHQYADVGNSGPSCRNRRLVVTTLEPILESRSKSSLRRTSSEIIVRPSLEKHSRFIKPKQSIHSVHLRNDLQSDLSGPSLPTHIKSFSLSDLDCLPKSDTKIAYAPEQDRSASFSSKLLLYATDSCPACPLTPKYEPPVRSPTPPGLPPFGSEEAQQYRLMPASCYKKTVSWLFQCFRRDNRNTKRQAPADLIDINSVAHNPTRLDSISSLDVLQRMLGVSRLVRAPKPNASARVPVPPGVMIANTTGVLAQAEDGTFVHGRWGNRTSGHGIGGRGLESHPLARAAGIDSIDAIVEEIDKACAAAEQYNAGDANEPRTNTTRTGALGTSSLLSFPDHTGQPATYQIHERMLTSHETAAQLEPNNTASLPKVGSSGRKTCCFWRNHFCTICCDLKLQWKGQI